MAHQLRTVRVADLVALGIGQGPSVAIRLGVFAEPAAFQAEAIAKEGLQGPCIVARHREGELAGVLMETVHKCDSLS